MKNFRGKMAGLKKQAGMTLTESLLVLGVGALAAALAYGGYKMATASVDSSAQIKGTVTLVSNIKRVFGTAANYSTVNVANVINAQLVPSDLRVNSTTAINNAWAGTITPEVGNQAGTTPTTQFKLTITNIPKDQCVDYLAGIASAGYSLWMGGTAAGTNDVKPAGGSFMPDRAATLCAASTPATAETQTAILVSQ